MNINRRNFLKLSGVTAVALAAPVGIVGGFLASVKTVRIEDKLFRAVENGQVYISHDDGNNWASLANFGAHLDIHSLTAIPGGRIYARFGINGHGFELIYTLKDNTWRTA